MVFFSHYAMTKVLDIVNENNEGAEQGEYDGTLSLGLSIEQCMFAFLY
jgi:hypothetical protein